MKTTIVKKLNDRSAVIGVLGLGYVGLPLVQRYSEVGYKVIGFDVDDTKIKSLREGRSYIKHIDHAKVADALRAGFEPTADFSRTREADALIICVPTPLNRYREPDLSYVVKTVEMCCPYLRKGQVVSLESTTYPGTTDEELLPRIESAGFTVGTDVFLVYSPEREDPGNPHFCTRTIPKVCGGYTANCLEVGIALYGQVIDKVVPVSSTRAAELTKLLENIHRAVNIGLVNEMKIVADRMGIDIHEVIRAAATKPFGFVPYQPGPGLGGHCIPIDPFYLTWKAREYGVHTKFIELAGEVNSSMPEWVVSKITEGLNSHRKSLNGSKVLILGVAYKKNIDDMRESPAFPIMNMLAMRGACVDYSDPYIPALVPDEHHRFSLKNRALDKKMLSEFDCVVIVTNHDNFDYEMIQQGARLIVDTRGVYAGPRPNVVQS